MNSDCQVIPGLLWGQGQLVVEEWVFGLSRIYKSARSSVRCLICPPSLCVTLWITLFTMPESRAIKGLCGLAEKLINKSGNWWLIHYFSSDNNLFRVLQNNWGNASTMFCVTSNLARILWATLWITLFTSIKSGMVRGFAGTAQKMTSCVEAAACRTRVESAATTF